MDHRVLLNEDCKKHCKTISDHPLIKLAEGKVASIEAHGVKHIVKGLSRRRNVCAAYADVHARIQLNIATSHATKKRILQSTPTNRESKHRGILCCVCRKPLRAGVGIQHACKHVSHKQLQCFVAQCTLCENDDKKAE